MFCHFYEFSLFYFITNIFLGTNATFFPHQPKEAGQDIQPLALQIQPLAQVTVPNLQAKVLPRVIVPNQQMQLRGSVPNLLLRHPRAVTAVRKKRKSQSFGTRKQSVRRKTKLTSLSESKKYIVKMKNRYLLTKM